MDELICKYDDKGNIIGLTYYGIILTIFLGIALVIKLLKW